MRRTWEHGRCGGLVAAAVVLAFAWGARGDTVTLVDGKVIENCFVRDEGIRLLVWEKMEDVGGPARVIPKSQVREQDGFKLGRTDAWDAHPDRADLSVTHIEMNPKRAGLHGVVDYDKYGRPVLGGPAKGKGILDLGERTAMEPAEAVKNLKLKYEPGEEITLTAHVRNVGFKAAAPFKYVWLIDDKEVANGDCAKALKEMEETSFTRKYKWEDGFHTVTFRVVTDQPEIATLNNEAKDPMWGWGFWFYVTNGRCDAWHKVRSAAGTFCWEDYYRWHVDMMNTLFAASVFPAAPEGIKARVRLDRIIYTDDLDKALERHADPKDGISYQQGTWIWRNDEDKDKKWVVPDKNWRNGTEWSLPHELGHQLGLTDWYCQDYADDKNFTWPDTGDTIAHLHTHPITMMEWHGPHVYSEVDAGYLNMTWDKPRGHFGDYYFAIPKDCYVQVVDVNGQPVPGAKVELFQRGTEADPDGKGGEDQGVKYMAVVEDGNFDRLLSKTPVIVGQTDAFGMMHLPNRPVVEVKTLNGYHRRPNPFGNINVVGQRGQMLVQVTKDGRKEYYWLGIYDFCTAWFRGQKDKYITVLRTPYRSASSPLPPRNVKVAPAEDGKVRVTWDAPEVKHEMQYLERVIGYRVYRRVSTMCLNDRPWFPVATVAPSTHEVMAVMKDRPEDVAFFKNVDRFAVTAIGETGVESEMVEVVLPEKK